MKKILYLIPILFTIIILNGNIFGASYTSNGTVIYNDFEEYSTALNLSTVMRNVIFSSLQSLPTGTTAFINGNSSTNVSLVTTDKLNMKCFFDRYFSTYWFDKLNFNTYFNKTTSWWYTGPTFSNPATVNVNVLDGLREGQAWKVYIYNSVLYTDNTYTSVLLPTKPLIPEIILPKLSVGGSYASDFSYVDILADIILPIGGEKIQYLDSSMVWKDYTSPLHYTTNQKVIFKLLSSTNIVLDSIDYNVIDLIDIDNSSNLYKVDYIMKDFKAYITPVSVGNFLSNVGVKVKLIDGFDNIVETGYDVFVEKTVNQQFILTGKKDTTFELLIEFYNKSTGDIFKDTTLTVYTKDGSGDIISDDGTSNSHFSDMNPSDPIGSMSTFLNESNSFFDFLKYVFSIFPVWVTAPISLLLVGTVIIALFKAFRG